MYENTNAKKSKQHILIGMQPTVTIHSKGQAKNIKMKYRTRNKRAE